MNDVDKINCFHLISIACINKILFRSEEAVELAKIVKSLGQISEIT